MNKILHFPLVRIIITFLFVGVGVVIGQTLLNLLRAALSIMDTRLANLLAFVLLVPLAYFAYWMYVRYVEKRDMTELGRANAFREFGLGAMIGFGLFALVIAILRFLG